MPTGVTNRAVSQAQQQFFAICEHNPKHARGKCPKMTKAQMHEFAATPTRKLPKKISSATRRGRP